MALDMAAHTLKSTPNKPYVGPNLQPKISKLCYNINITKNIILPMVISLITNLKRCLPPKYSSQICYYTYRSFKPPREIRPRHRKCETARYDIYNPVKDLLIAKILPCLQNILHMEMMAIDHHRYFAIYMR